jgi:peptidoglycan/LPS O-acetylase OafA/YrhL
MSAVLILTTLLSPHSLLAAPLSLGVLVWFGHISYSLYLWHLPVAKLLPVERLARHGLSGWMATAVCVLLSTAIAAASYYGIERTFQRLREKARA